MRALLLTLAFAATAVSAGEVYRSVAPDGTWIYSDVPTGPNAEPFYVAVPKSSSTPSKAATPDATAQPAAAGAAGAAGAAPPGAAQQPADPKSQTPTAEERAKRCDAARKRAESYSQAPRLYRVLPSGEREYLSDSEIDEARAKAAADVETWCN
ncbi:MAG TPA: hypothetical protein VFV10_01175 [Gammaproteobacteria bacterium]|nr:hypothetical protein [Gammaproteobacteria bacterium]